VGRRTAQWQVNEASVRDPGEEIALLQVTDAAISVLKREILHQGEPPQEDESVKAIRLQRTRRLTGSRPSPFSP
jgi:hypothetical protein